MKGTKVVVATFMLGCSLLVAAYGIGWADWGHLSNQEVIMQILLGAIATMIVILATISVATRSKVRWTTLTLDSILFLGLSVLVFFSVGWIVAPLALILLVFSLSRFVRLRSERRTA